MKLERSILSSSFGKFSGELLHRSGDNLLKILDIRMKNELNLISFLQNAGTIFKVSPRVEEFIIGKELLWYKGTTHPNIQPKTPSKILIPTPNIHPYTHRNIQTFNPTRQWMFE
jgi:hypothetical protein